MTKQHQYSVVVRTWNSECTLAKTIRSLSIQTPPPREVIVVDSGSSDKTLDIATRFGAKVLTYPSGESFNYSRSLNIGIAAATSELVLIISSHTVVPYKNIVKSMLDQLRIEGRVGAYCVPTWLNPGSDAGRRRPAIKAVEIKRGSFDGYNGLWNTCSLIRKVDWAIHPFDETTWTAEDQEWALWHFTNRDGTTIRLEGTGTIDLNPRRSPWKAVREHVAVASRYYPPYYRWRTIFARFARSGLALLRLKRAKFKHELLFASVLLLHRASLLNFDSSSPYHSSPPRILKWLAR